ncbi:MAG: NAD(P)/FAD-dependent oxidoreductase [Candidatus Omnitrophota bacterium]|jgi:prolycopene isomerase
MDYDAIIIGAGVAGLASAVKLSSKGKKILLIEKLPVPGGFVTTFSRKGFVFESALHCVDGLQEKGEVRKILGEYGIDKKVDFIDLADFSRVIYPEYDFTSNFKRDEFVAYLKKEFSPEEAGIDKLFLAIDKFYHQVDWYKRSNLPLPLKLICASFMCPMIIRTSMITFEEFLNEFVKDIKLKGIITNIWNFVGLPPARISAFYFLVVFTGYHYVPTAYIRGSSSALFKAIVEKIKENGSEVKFNTQVSRIVTEGGKTVKAVVTDKGEVFTAKSIISNANPLDTFDKLIDNSTVKEAYRKKFSGLEKSISAFQIYLGLKTTAKNLGMSHYMYSINISYDHEEDLRSCFSADYEQRAFALVDHSRLDPNLAPVGKGTLLIMVLDSYTNWKDLSPQDYKAKKEQVARKLIERCEKYLPGLSANIEVMEIATPKTMERYGSSPEGAIYGFAQTPAQSVLRRTGYCTQVRGLYLTGAWTQPGAGVHACFVSGVDAADTVLRYLK